MKETRPIKYCGWQWLLMYTVHCESLVGGNTKRQQWPSLYAIVNLVLVEIANVDNALWQSIYTIHRGSIVGGNSKRQQWPSIYTVIVNLLVEIANFNTIVHHCAIYNRLTQWSTVEARPIICCWWRWLLIDTMCVYCWRQYLSINNCFGLLFK